MKLNLAKYYIRFLLFAPLKTLREMTNSISRIREKSGINYKGWDDDWSFYIFLAIFIGLISYNIYNWIEQIENRANNSLERITAAQLSLDPAYFQCASQNMLFKRIPQRLQLSKVYHIAVSSKFLSSKPKISAPPLWSCVAQNMWSNAISQALFRYNSSEEFSWANFISKPQHYQ